MPIRIATRTDQSGIREDALFLPAHGNDLFLVLHRPAERPRGALVICCSLFAEQLKLYRAEVLVARALAAAGFAVARFHYRGTGHSGGLSEAATVPIMVEDASIVADFLAQDASMPVAFCGARWGGLIAGLAALRRPRAPLVLWEPVLDGGVFFRQAFRARRMSVLVAGGAAGRPLPGLAELQRDGVVDLLGYPVFRALYESGAERNLMRAAEGPPRPVLLIQVNRHEGLTPEFAALVAALRAAGSTVDVALIQREEVWTFVGKPVHSTQEMITTTLPWLGMVTAPGLGTAMAP